MLGVDSEIGTSALRLWVAAGSAALLIVVFARLFFRSPPDMPVSRISRAGFVIIPAVLGAAIAWAFLDRSDLGKAGAERRAFELRAEELSGHALAPGSPLACLDALAGESVEAACEKALFASPASVASASSYVAARLALLASMSAYAKRSGTDVDDVLLPLRRSLEADRFGFLAHVLAVRDGCTSQNCKALAVLRDAGRVRANLSAATLDGYLERYVALWSAAPDGALADGKQATVQPNAPDAHKMVNIDFPSSASIPAVSIMNPEPPGTGAPNSAGASNPNPQPTAQHRTQKQAGTQSVQHPAQSAPSGTTVTEPIWPEPVPAVPTAQPPATPASAAPMQLTPPSPTPAATAARTQ
jgi:hypothetical protein